MKQLIFLCTLAVFLSACAGQPVLEAQECIASRSVVKRVYSIYLDNVDPAKKVRLEKVRNLITKNLFEKTSSTETDYLTKSKKLPVAARVGACRMIDKKPSFEVKLFWRNESGATEEQISVIAEKDTEWLISDVEKN